ncbi:hypothetical protein ACET3Z_008833 [Daucus carota]
MLGYPKKKGQMLNFVHLFKHKWELTSQIKKPVFWEYVCHNWSDERCLKLLKNCYQALTKKGKVIIVESISQEVPDSDIATKHVYDVDVAMLTRTPSGKERTENEFAALIKDAGFTVYGKKLHKLLVIDSLLILLGLQMRHFHRVGVILSVFETDNKPSYIPDNKYLLIPRFGTWIDVPF